MADALIRKLERYAKLSSAEKELLKVASAARSRRLVPHENLVLESESPAGIFLVLEGWAARLKQLEDGRRQIVNLVLPGDLSHYYPGGPREMDHTIAAISGLTVAEIPHQTFNAIVSAHPRLARAFWWEATVQLAVQREWTVNVGQREAPERLAHLFCELWFRLAVVGLNKGDSIEFPLIQSEIGEAVGMSTVHVNRTLQHLRAEGLIDLSQRQLTILDRARLMSAGGFAPDYLSFNAAGPKPDA